MKIVHCKREPYTEYIGRPSRFGNPYSLEEYGREEAVAKYEDYARKNSKLLEWIRLLPEDAVLGCWCFPRLCHGDVIMKLWKEMHVEKEAPGASCGQVCAP